MQEQLSADFSDLEVVTDFCLGGSQTWVQRSAAAKYIGTKASKAIATCHSIGRLPLPSTWLYKNPLRVSFGSELFGPNTVCVEIIDFCA